MTIRRRSFLRLAGSLAAVTALPRTAIAQAYPSQPVRIVVPYAAGGPNDILARLIGQPLSERLGQPFIVENRPGAGGNIGTEAVVRAPNDGYTLVMLTTASAINAALHEKLNFDVVRDISAIAGILRGPNIMVINPSVPANSVSEFIAYAKSRPGKINMASPGIGTGPHMTGELFKMMAGVDLVHVPYRGNGPAVTDLIAGHTEVMFSGTVGLVEHLQAGKLRALGVTSRTRSELLPDLPAIGEFVPGYETIAWYGIGAPKSTPQLIVDKLNTTISDVLSETSIKAKLVQQGGTAFIAPPAEFGKHIADEIEKWAKVIKFAGIKPG